MSDVIPLRPPADQDTHALVAKRLLMAALANYHAVVHCGETHFRAVNELSEIDQCFYAWAVKRADEAIWQRRYYEV